MLVSKAKAREIRAGMAELIYLVPELCRLTGLTDNERSDFRMMRDLATHTRLKPDQRVQRLHAFSQRMRSTPKVVEELKRWNMEMAEHVVRLKGRQLPPERIQQGGGATYVVGENAEWTPQMRDKKMVSLPLHPVQSWALIYPQMLRDNMKNFTDALNKVSRGMSLCLPQPTLVEIRDDSPGTYLSNLENVINNQKPAFVLCCASNTKTDRYSAIKKKCYVDRAMPCQVGVRKSLAPKSGSVMSIATKIAIQINCKLGGAPWAVEMPITGLMVVGFDVCHDTSNRSRSFGALVASLNKGCTRYFSCCSPHTNGEELSNDFSLNMVKAVRRYKEINEGQLPSMIVIYRDGVGDGQLDYVYTHEVKMIENSLKEFYGETPLKLAFIVVTKRINTRFFQVRHEGRYDNPPAGTVIDDVVTLPQRWDFFIVSQCVREGTVSPTAYNVLLNQTNLNSDKLQRLSYKLTHMYYNWSGTVRVPAPCQYAHKLAFLVSQYLHRNPNPALETTLYFL